MARFSRYTQQQIKSSFQKVQNGTFSETDIHCLFIKLRDLAIAVKKPSKLNDDKRMLLAFSNFISIADSFAHTTLDKPHGEIVKNINKTLQIAMDNFDPQYPFDMLSQVRVPVINVGFIAATMISLVEVYNREYGEELNCRKILENPYLFSCIQAMILVNMQDLEFRVANKKGEKETIAISHLLSHEGKLRLYGRVKHSFLDEHFPEKFSGKLPLGFPIAVTDFVTENNIIYTEKNGSPCIYNPIWGNDGKLLLEQS